MNSDTSIPDCQVAQPVTYPARPINGGPLEKAPPKHGNWCYEPKINGWRVLVHVPTGSMFNRHGNRLSIAAEFEPGLRQVKQSPFEWLDCEGLERRHSLGRGSLVVLDWVTASLGYEQRRAALVEEFQSFEAKSIKENRVWLVPSVSFDIQRLWNELQQQNCELLPILGEHTSRYFRQNFKIEIDGDKLPEAHTQELLNELQTLFAKHQALDALNVSESIKPVSEFHAARHVILTPERNFELNQLCPIIAMVKTKGRK